jgi:hypothetical protein
MDTSGAPDRGQVQRYLQLLHRCGEFVFLALDDIKPPRFAADERVASKIVGMTLRQYERGAGVFVTVNESDGRGRRADQIIRVRAIWQEDDSGFDGVYPLEPSFIVETSPGHRHVYWLVSDHWPADAQGVCDFNGIMERVVADYGSDPNAKDIARVLRVPGFCHRKDPDRPHLVRIVEASGKRYTRSELIAAFPPIARQSAAGPAGNAFTSFASPIDIERVRAALAFVPADDRKIWLEVGMALKSELGDAGRELFDEWSATSKKFDVNGQEKAWNSLGKRSGVTLGTLYYYAKEGGWTGTAEDARVTGLGRLSELSYAQRRASAAKDIGIPVGTLDKLVRQARAKAAEEGEELPHWQVEPWPDPVDTSELLTELEREFRRYIVLPPGAFEALPLWVLHVWVHDAGDVSPFMVLVSPTKRCGKTSLLTILYYLTPRSELASNISPSAVYRYIEDVRPTLLIDEADSFIRDNEEMRGILNSGHTRSGAYVIRNVEVNGVHKPRRFSTWAPKAIACIRALADTIDDRSIILTLQRKLRTANVGRLRKRDNEVFATLRRKAARWAQDNAALLGDPDPAIPEVLNDRAADNWRPLIAIADLAGPAWGRRAREAACTLSGDGADTAINVEILADLKTIFDAVSEKESVFSAVLIEQLTADPERPWAEWSRGKPLTQKQLAGLLRPFGITSRTVYPSGRSGPQGKGYTRASLETAWAAYLPSGKNPAAAPADATAPEAADTPEPAAARPPSGQNTSPSPLEGSLPTTRLHRCNSSTFPENSSDYTPLTPPPVVGWKTRLNSMKSTM